MNLSPATYREIDFTEPVTANGAGFEFVGCRFSRGLVWMGSGAGRVVECVFAGNPAKSAIYSHNHWGGTREISRCLFLNDASQSGLHVYSGSTNCLRDYYIHDCVHLAPSLIGGGGGVKNLRYQNNYHLCAYSGFGTYARAGITNDGYIVDNTFVNPSTIDVMNGFTVSNNKFMSVTAREVLQGFDLWALPRDYSVFIPFSECGRWNGIYATVINGIPSAHIMNKKHERGRRFSVLDIFTLGLAAAITIRRRKED